MDAPSGAGVEIAKNMCPSQGTMDIFVEPVLPPSSLWIIGASPVAIALEEIAARFGFSCNRASDPPVLSESASLPAHRFVVVSTQGAGDLKALEAALNTEAEYVAFVGSRKKTKSLALKLEDKGLPKQRLQKLKAPAGLDIGAITPDEIALSIVAEMIQVKRQGQRDLPPNNKE